MTTTVKQKLTKEQADKLRVLTPEFRVSYPHVFKPQSIDPKTEPKYSISMLFSKDTDMTPILRAVRRAKIYQFGDDKKKWPKGLLSPIDDGDDPRHANKEGYKGHWVVKASTSQDQKPGVVDQNVEPIVDASKFYAGCYARAYVFANYWTYLGKVGVSFILDHVQKSRDGQSLGGKKPVDSVFTKIETDDVADSDDDSEDDDDTAESGSFM